IVGAEEGCDGNDDAKCVAATTCLLRRTSPCAAFWPKRGGNCIYNRGSRDRAVWRAMLDEATRGVERLRCLSNWGQGFAVIEHAAARRHASATSNPSDTAAS